MGNFMKKYALLIPAFAFGALALFFAFEDASSERYLTMDRACYIGSLLPAVLAVVFHVLRKPKLLISVILLAIFAAIISQTNLILIVDLPKGRSLGLLVASLFTVLDCVLVMWLDRANLISAEKSSSVSGLPMFFKQRNIYALVATILAAVAWAVFTILLNKNADSWNQSVSTDSVNIGSLLGAASFAIPIWMIIIGTVFCLVCWLFKQRWAAIVASIFLGIAVITKLSYFYVPSLPFAFSIVAFVNMKGAANIKANEYSKPAHEGIKQSSTKSHEQTIKQESAAVQTLYSPVDELKKYKELLDMGAITQEEYDTKKKQILNL